MTNLGIWTPIWGS